MTQTGNIPIKSEFFLGSGGGFFSFPLLAFWPSLLGLEASAMLVPELEATEVAASLVSVRAAGTRGLRTSMAVRSHIVSFLE